MAAPKPLTPPGLDLRDFSWLPLDVVMLENSETWALAGAIPFARGACISLWTRAWHQVPAASLPNNETVLAKWADVPDWESVCEIALRGFVECSDGRLYHKVLAVKANEAQATREKKAGDREADRKRIQQWREKQKAKQKQQMGNADDTITEPVTKRARTVLEHTIPYHTPPSKEREYGDGIEDAATLASPLDSGSLHGAEKEGGDHQLPGKTRQLDDDIFSDPNPNTHGKPPPVNGETMAEFLAREGIVKGSMIVTWNHPAVTYLTPSGERICVEKPKDVLGKLPDPVE